MKIEKINESQIRCTLTKDDLAVRQIRLSELAYGTEKANRLFEEMISFAEKHFDFDTEEMPLMVEAIPCHDDTITIIVTKVAFPDELDTRFSTFSDAPEGTESLFGDIEEAMEELPIAARGAANARDILTAFAAKNDESKLSLHKNSSKKENDSNSAANENEPTETVDPSAFVRLYELKSLEDLISLAHILNGYYHADNTLYRGEKKDSYFLVLHIGNHTAAQYNKVCNIAAEYGHLRRVTTATGRHFDEHARTLIAHNALQQLVMMPLTSKNC